MRPRGTTGPSTPARRASPGRARREGAASRVSPGREVELLVVERVVGDVHLAVDAEQAAVGVDHRRAVVIDARRPPLEERGHDGQLPLRGQLGQGLAGLAGDRLGQVEEGRVLPLAEVLGAEELGKAGEPCPPAGGGRPASPARAPGCRPAARSSASAPGLRAPPWRLRRAGGGRPARVRPGGGPPFVRLRLTARRADFIGLRAWLAGGWCARDRICHGPRPDSGPWRRCSCSCVGSSRPCRSRGSSWPWAWPPRSGSPPAAPSPHPPAPALYPPGVEPEPPTPARLAGRWLQRDRGRAPRRALAGVPGGLVALGAPARTAGARGILRGSPGGDLGGLRRRPPARRRARRSRARGLRARRGRLAAAQGRAGVRQWSPPTAGSPSACGAAVPRW